MIDLKQAAPLIAGVLAAILWAVNTQIGYSLVSLDCALASNLEPLVAAICFAFALAAGVLSLQAWLVTAVPNNGKQGAGGESREFIASVCVFIAAIFALAILLQGIAGLIISGCLR